MKKRISFFNLFNAAMLLIVVLVTIYPFIYMISISLSSEYYVIKNDVFLYPKGFNLDVYKKVLGDERIWTGYYNTVRYVVLGTVIALLVTSTGAYALSKSRMPMGKTFILLIVGTIFFKGGIIPTFLVVKELNLLNSIWAMVLPGAVITMYLLIMRTFFQALPIELEEAGRIDGLNDIGLFVRIVLPLSKAVFASIGMFYAILLWNNFFTPLLYLRETHMMPLQVVLRNLVLAGMADTQSGMPAGGDEVILEEPLKYATIMVATLPILLVYPFIQKYFVQGVMIGAVKG